MHRSAVFDAHYRRYEKWFATHETAYRSELLAVRALLPWEGFGLEIGVGTGRFAAPLGVRVGLDPSMAMLDYARARGIRVVRGVAEQLPFAAASFDYALIVTTICFADDAASMLGEARRVIKLDGVLVVGFIDRESELGRIYERKREQSIFYRDATFYSVRELVGLLHEAGFEDFSYRQTLFAGEPSDITVREGFGEGGFVAVKAHNK